LKLKRTHASKAKNQQVAIASACVTHHEKQTPRKSLKLLTIGLYTA
jgi:hypothetical protein